MDKIGGQAVIEGVMMKSKRGWTVAVRDPRGEIHVKKQTLRKLPRVFRLPLLRGFLTLVHTLTIGIMALEFSATKAYDEDEEPLTRTSIALTIGAAFLIGIGLFILLPLYAAKVIGFFLKSVEESSVLFNLVDGVVRVAVFLLYVVLIGLWGEIARIFEYHGAEHKAIHALEADEDLQVENVRRHSPQHPRCGTSFLMIVMVMSILIFSLIPQSWSFAYKALSRIVLIPLLAGVSYEALKFSARMKDNPFVKPLILPGLLLQRLTTREPDDVQLEVAIKALTEVLSMEEDSDAQEA
jgi:uncharacterized protein YqhQ